MALQLGALRDALIDAGASAEKAGRAAEEMAAYRIHPDVRLDTLRDGLIDAGASPDKVERAIVELTEHRARYR
jgi:hypothetical protein